MPADYEFSSAYVLAIVNALKRDPGFNDLEAVLPGDVSTLVRNPFARPWQPAKQLEALGEAAVETLGAATFEALTYAAVKERFGPIVMPLLGSSVTKKSPGQVLARLDQLVKVAVKGATLHFQAESEHGGTLLVSYPRPVAAHVLTSWTGLLRFVFELTVPGRILHQEQVPPGDTLKYVVAWD